MFVLFSPEEETLWTRRRFYMKQCVLVRVAGQGMDRYSDTKPELTVIFVISMLAVKILAEIPALWNTSAYRSIFTCSAGFYIL